MIPSFLTSSISSGISASVVTSINHLLSQEAWAREKLQAHAGKTACLDAEVTVLHLRVAVDGLIEPAEGKVPVNVTIRIKAADFLLIAQQRDRAFSYVKIEGDADFANIISQLSQSLRWDVEADLAKWVGDIAAVRLVSAAKTGVDTAKSVQIKLAENVAEFFLEEQPMLVHPQAVLEFTRDVVKLRDDVERLSKRIEKLAAKCC